MLCLNFTSQEEFSLDVQLDSLMLQRSREHTTP